MNCPLCDLKMVVNGDLHEDGSISCPDKHYYYNHSYGGHEEVVDAYGDGHIIFSVRWSYTEPSNERIARNAAVKAFTDYAKELRKK